MRLVASRVMLLFWFFALAEAFAQSRTNLENIHGDPRGDPELVVCSQNLANYGSLNSVRLRDPGMTPDSLKIKEQALLRRFSRVGCDVIAVQEVLGRTELDADEALRTLAKGLEMRTRRRFEVRTGASSDPLSRLGFLVAKDRAEIMNTASYSRVELPRLTEDQRPRLFTRGPLEIQLAVRPRAGSYSKTVTLVNFHFKSKRGGADDPAALEWETSRMEMAEGLRRIVENRLASSYATGETILILLGDRNSNFDVASARILEGSVTLRLFQKEGLCRLSKRGLPLCQPNAALPQKLFSVLTRDPQTRTLPGTFVYRKVYSWLDDIIMPAESLAFAHRVDGQEGAYESGVLYGYPEASDHALVHVTLNW